MHGFFVRVPVIIVVGCLVAGCEQTSQTNTSGRTPLAGERSSPPVKSDLYQRLGGEERIRQLVSAIADRAVEKSAVNFDRDGMPEQWSNSPENLQAFKDGLSEWVIHFSGGPPRYRGEELGEAHRGMRISHAEFNAFLAEAEGAMKDQKLGSAERKDLLALLETARERIVEAR